MLTGSNVIWWFRQNYTSYSAANNYGIVVESVFSACLAPERADKHAHYNQRIYYANR
jgi:hypothetical protein